MIYYLVNLYFIFLSDKSVRKNSSLPYPGFDLQIDIMLVDDPPDNIESDAKSPFVEIFTVVALENLFRFFYTDTVISDRKDNFPLTQMQSHFDTPLFMAVFDGIGDGVVHDALKLCGIEVEGNLRLDI